MRNEIRFYLQVPATQSADGARVMADREVAYMLSRRPTHCWLTGEELPRQVAVLQSIQMTPADIIWIQEYDYTIWHFVYRLKEATE